MAKVTEYKIYCETDAQWERWFLDENDPAPTTCPVDTGHTVTGASVSIVKHIGPNAVEVTNDPVVHTRKPTGSRAYVFGVDFCDRKTWYVESVKVTDEAVGTGDGATTVFNLDHGTNAVADEAILDLTRGLITDDHLMAPPGGAVGDYKPVVKIDGVEKTAREPYETTGGDYEINFDTGVITFYVAPGNTLAITATYYYVPASVGPLVVAGPPAGKVWVIDKAEAQITADFTTDDWFTDTILMNVFYAPLDLADPANEVRYYNYGNLLDYSSGSFVEYPVVAGTRGYNKTTRIFRWDYLTPITLAEDYELRAWTKHQRALGATRATIVMYALEEDAA
jgi:hypothetical protein